MKTQTHTWEKIARWEPKVRKLEVLTRGAMTAIADDKGDQWCANRFFYGYVKPFICVLVGDCRGYPLEEASPHDGLRFVTGTELMQRPRQPRSRATNDRERFLRSSEAYDIVYDHLYEMLPYCRNCMCM